MLSLCVLIYIIPEVLSATLPDHIQTLTNTSSVCFGTHTQFKPSCETMPDTVIAVNAVKVASKRVSHGCPDSVTDSYPVDVDCCMPNTTTDCIFDFDYKDSGLDFKFHKLCSGYEQCTSVAGAVYARTECSDPTYEYMNLTSLMFMEYACVEATRIHSIATNGSFDGGGESLYLQTNNYPEAFQSGNFQTKCNISTNVSEISVYTVDVRLSEENDTCMQVLSLKDNTKVQSWDCTYEGAFAITETTFSNEVEFVFESYSSVDQGHVWLGFAGGSLFFDCSTTHGVRTETTTTSSPSTAPPTLTSSPVRSTDSAGYATTGKSVPIGAIVGGVAGILVIVVIAVIVRWICTRGTKVKTGELADESVGEDEQMCDEQNEMGTFPSDQCLVVQSQPPSNTHFHYKSYSIGDDPEPDANGTLVKSDPSTNASTTRNTAFLASRQSDHLICNLSPTPYLAEHDSLNQRRLPPIKDIPSVETDNNTHLIENAARKKRKKKKLKFKDEENITEEYPVQDNDNALSRINPEIDHADDHDVTVKKKKKKKKKKRIKDNQVDALNDDIYQAAEENEHLSV